MADFFNRKRQEVEKVTLLDYTFERRLELVARDSKAEGMAEGKAEGLAEGKAVGLVEGKAEGAQNQLIILVKKGKLSLNDAASEAGMTPEEFEKLMA